jgi:hypothetical protein
MIETSNWINYLIQTGPADPSADNCLRTTVPFWVIA